jgi:hypothetical protein
MATALDASITTEERCRTPAGVPVGIDKEATVLNELEISSEKPLKSL